MNAPQTAASNQLASIAELLTLTLVEPADASRNQRIAVLGEVVRKGAATGPHSYLRTRLGLEDDEVKVVWLLAAMAIEPELRRFVAIGDPTLETIRRLSYGRMQSHQALHALGAQGRLRSLHLIERSDGGGPHVHEHQQTWAISRRVLALLLGDLAIDSELARLVSIPDAVPALDELAIAADTVTEVRDLVTRKSGLLIATGLPGSGRTTTLIAAATFVGRQVIEIRTDRLSKEHDGLQTQLRRIARECLLQDRAPLFTGLDDLTTEALDLIGSEFAPHVPGLILATARLTQAGVNWDRPTLILDMKQPTAKQTAALWLNALGQGTESDGAHLSNQYPLAPGFIRRAAEVALSRAGGRKLTPDDVQVGVRSVLDTKLGKFAKRVTVQQDWDDIVLERDQIIAITELIARVRARDRVYEEWGFAKKVGRGLGIAALFSGPPGTGKTMTAGLIARDLGLDLYQVDTSKLSSKWIGETEKNLSELFDAAESCNAMLLFDEADALFGRRSEQKSSNDRHANSETNYLLQRVEAYRGVCILTSNHAANMDPAFQRRLALHLRFEIPEFEERVEIWKAMFPANAPLDPGMDFESLARRFEMTGGYIKNAALRAAFVAAAEDVSISQAHIEHAARAEYEGMGKIVSGGVHLF